MTGFGRGTAVLKGREITVELRSVNSRYFEYSSRIPRTCSSLDSRLKKQLNQRISRGKVELSMTVQNVDAADTVVAVNMELARSYQQAMRDLSEQLGVKNDVSTAVLTRFPDVLTTRHADVDEEQLWQDVSAVTAQALDRFVEMRAAEGAKMKADVESRLVFLEQCVGKVESLSAGRVENYTNRLYEKLKVILQDRDIDDARVLTEAAIFGDKTAVDEETVRLRSHIAVSYTHLIMLAQMAQDPKTANKPEAVKEKMIQGKIKKFFKENCLVDQEFVKDGDLSLIHISGQGCGILLTVRKN